MNTYSDTRTAFAVVVTTAADLEDVQALAAPFPVTVVALGELQQSVVQTDGSGRPICVERKGDLIGVVTATPASAEEIIARRDLLSLLTGPAGLDHLRIDCEGALGFGSWLCRRIADLAAACLKDAAQLRRSNAVLRREHDDMLERFTLLERDYIRAVPPRISKLDYPAAGVGCRVRALVQRLPVSPMGIGVLDLKVNGVSPEARGVLHVELFAQGRRDALQRWSLEAAQLTPGWISLRAERAIAVTAMEMRLELRWDGEPGQAPLLELSTPTPLDEYAAKSADASEPARPLALRLWSFAPGSRLPTEDFQEDRASTGIQDKAPLQFGLSTKEFSRSELLEPLGLDLGFALVAFRPETGDILVHPNASGLTVAVIRDVPVVKARGLKAIVRVDHKRAHPVEFGLALAPSQPINSKPAESIKAWTRVGHSVFAEAIGHVEEGAGPYDLVMATRMADGADPDLAWALFKKIEVIA